MFKHLTVREIAVAAALAAFSAIVQLVHLGYQSPQWGMWIDVVAVTWVVALFLFGFRLSFIVSLVGALMITLFAPETWLGAGMKWIASVPVLITLSWWVLVQKKPYGFYKNPKHLIIPVVVGLIIRALVVVPVNYFYAIPIWTGMSPAKAMLVIPWYIIVLFNVIQGVVDVVFAWILVYRFRLDRYSSHK